jgi:hypothetical protein
MKVAISGTERFILKRTEVCWMENVNEIIIESWKKVISTYLKIYFQRLI